MLLKRVELTGFKSFATKTAIDFLPGITIIVGPNGCGKSNIFDAVRWVLGEQSAKSLRGTRMGDVIFAGSSSYKAMSYSQVSLIIDNTDRKMPVDFSEISVTRRLFTTGESEYLLNKVPCRMRDIVELFMDTGIGIDAYSFMEQGRVDLIIRAKPRERRYIFEEAAGISKYKARKEEALRKLIRTEEDLLRLRDIIEEVGRNAASLKRQAAKAERYKKLVGEQRDIEKRLLILRYKFLEENFSSIEGQYNEISQRHAEISARIATLDAQNEERRTESDFISQKLSETQSLSFSINSDMEKTRHQISLLNERMKNAEESAAKLAREIDEERERKIKFEEDQEQLLGECDDSEKSLVHIEQDYQEKKKVFDDLKISQQEKLLQLEKFRKEQSLCHEEKTRLLNEIRYSDAMSERIKAQLRDDEEALEEERSSLTAVVQGLKVKKDSLAEAEKEIQQLKDNYQAETEALKNAENELEQVRGESETRAKNLHESESRLVVLQEMMQNFEGFQHGVKAVMKAAEKGEVTGISGTTATCITLPQQFEQAIETALGASLQSIIASKTDQVEKAILYLKEKKAGQAFFLPKDLAYFENTNGHMTGILQEQGVLGLARDMINVNSDNKILVDALLGDTVVVDSFGTALRLCRSGKRARYVTLEGECIEPNGVVLGGMAAKSTILSRERVARELTGKISDLRQACESLMNKIKDTRENIEKRRDLYNRLLEDLHDREVKRAALLKDVESAEQEYSGIDAEVLSLERKVSVSRQELDKFEKIISQNSSEGEKLATQIAELDKKVEDLISSIDLDKKQVARYDEIVSSLLLEQTREKERCHALRERLQMMEKNLKASLSSIKTKEEELGTLTDRKAEIIASIKESEAKLNTLLKDRDEAERKVTLCTQEHETIILDLKKLGQEITVLKREYNEVQNSLHEIDLKRTQYAAQKESLSQQSEEKFQKGILEIMQEMGEVTGDRDALLFQMNEIKEKIDHIGPINAEAIDQYQEAVQRYEFLTAQEKDLSQAKESLQKTITHIDQTTTQLFSEAFEKIRSYFIDTFRILFGGGRADLLLVTDEENKELEPGIEIVAQPPGKKLQNIHLLSGGEKSLTAIALLFSIFMYKPSPFCLMDEIDAALDDVNIGRFKNLIHKFSENTQFIVVTHNKQTMSLADTIYGVTMEEPGVSKLVSVKFENLEESKLIE